MVAKTRYQVVVAGGITVTGWTTNLPMVVGQAVELQARNYAVFIRQRHPSAVLELSTVPAPDVLADALTDVELFQLKVSTILNNLGGSIGPDPDSP